MKKLQVVLASESPRRKELLESLGIRPIVVPSGFDENSVSEEGLGPDSLVEVLACRKAETVSRIHADHLILGADTLVYLKGEILGKPKNRDEAWEMLKKLSGNTHKVYTGIALYEPRRKQVFSDVDCSYVTFVDMSPYEIQWYVETDEPIGKAGGYAIQGRAALFVSRIIGDYTSVIGLSLPKFYNLLKQADISFESLIS